MDPDTRKQVLLGNGWNALMFATDGGHADIVEALIRAGDDANHDALHGWKPLMPAASKGHAQTVQTLIRFGAKVDSYRCDESAPEFRRTMTALMLAAQNGDKRTVEILLEAGAKVDHPFAQSHLHRRCSQTAL
jgi:ankyrin repeat protein